MKKFISIIYGILVPGLGLFLLAAYYYMFYYTKEFTPNPSGDMIIVGLGLVSVAIGLVWWSYIVPLGKTIDAEDDVIIIPVGHRNYDVTHYYVIHAMEYINSNEYGDCYFESGAQKYYYLASNTKTIYIGEELHLLLNKAEEEPLEADGGL
jgi:hypothetical protein